MIKFIIKLIFGDYNQRIGKSMSAFTKIIENCKKLNEEMLFFKDDSVDANEEKIYSLDLEIGDIEKSIARNDKFMNNVQKITE